MDGRCQGLVGEWAKKGFGVEYPDTITIAGLDGVLIENAGERERALAMGRISAEKHGAKNAVVVGHSGCAGYVVDDNGHRDAVKKSAQIIKDSNMFENVVGLFVDVEKQSIEEVCRL